MENLKDMVTKIEELNKLINTDVNEIPPPNRLGFSGLQRKSELDLRDANLEYKRAIAKNIELLLISGPGEEEALNTLHEMEVITVNAQSIYEDLEKTTRELAGTNRLTSTAFTKLDAMINNLYRLTGLKKPAYLVSEETGDTVSMSENARNVVRRQFKGAGIEPASVIYEAVNVAYNKKVTELPILIVAYNLKGAVKSDYEVAFTSIHEYSLERGDRNEVIKMLKNVRHKLKTEGKIKSKTETKSETETVKE